MRKQDKTRQLVFKNANLLKEKKKGGGVASRREEGKENYSRMKTKSDLTTNLISDFLKLYSTFF